MRLDREQKMTRKSSGLCGRKVVMFWDNVYVNCVQIFMHFIFVVLLIECFIIRGNRKSIVSCCIIVSDNLREGRKMTSFLLCSMQLREKKRATTSFCSGIGLTSNNFRYFRPNYWICHKTPVLKSGKGD